MNQLIEAKLEELLAAIDACEDTWIKEWISVGPPKNFTTKKSYRGVNVFLLWAAQHSASYPTASWASYKQWAAEGYQVRRDERSTVIFITKDAVKAGGDKNNPEDVYRLMRCAYVFNAAQLTAPPAEFRSDPLPEVRHDDAEATIRATGARFTEGDPAYIPALDLITMPALYAFTSPASYYTTYFHELTHWTGHKDRLPRGLSYAEEELVAEFGAWFLSAEHGLDDGIRDNAAAYLKAWLARVQGDRGRALMAAASAASKATEFILKFKREEVMDS